jgi:hypothetical protein
MSRQVVETAPLFYQTQCTLFFVKGFEVAPHFEGSLVVASSCGARCCEDRVLNRFSLVGWHFQLHF